jgi:CheY-like chemotaxis protein
MNADNERRLTGRRILIVEDDPPSARMLTALLDSEGADVMVAHNADDALLQLERVVADLAIVDLILPTASGITLVRHLKQDERTRPVVVIGVSVLNGGHIEQLALDSGCAAFLRKPLEIDVMVKTVLRLLKASEHE